MYKLPKLSYLYQDLEPFIDTHTIGVHYHKHEQNYLNNLNDLLKKNYFDFRYSINELVYHINEFNINDKEDILFNLGGVLNHILYFNSIGKNNILPSENLINEINNTYKSYENFLKVFKEEALKLKGSGYTFLVSTKEGILKIMNFKNQDIPQLYGYIPLINIDLWEHAYYLNYKNDKSKYIDNFYKIINFETANYIYNTIIKKRNNIM